VSQGRDLARDLEWINDPDVCLSPRVWEIASHAIRRAQEAEAENLELKCEIDCLKANLKTVQTLAQEELDF